MQAHAEEAWADTRNLMYRHPLLVVYLVVGLITIATGVALDAAGWDLVVFGYAVAGLAILLEYVIRGR